MRATLLLIPALVTVSATGQILTQATSIPAIGTVENRTYYTDFSATSLVTSGTGIVWNMSALTPFGVTSTSTYRVASDSPYLGTYPGTTMCMERVSGIDTEWRHYNVTASIAELLGVNTDVFVNGRTYCQFPFSLGSTFSDDYMIGATTFTNDAEYVASGEILAPWGTVSNVVMYAMDGGSSYLFFMAGNVLDPIGSYMPGFGVDLWEVEVVSGVEEANELGIGAWPVPAEERVVIALPFRASALTISDAVGRTIMTMTPTAVRFELGLEVFMPGSYTVLATGTTNRVAAGRIVVR